MNTKNPFKYWPVAVFALFAAACTDTWDDHYGSDRVVSEKTLLQLVQEAGDLGDFLSVLEHTHVFNNNKPTDVTYADLLGSDQTMTVWAPVDGSFNVDSLLEECRTVQGDSACGQHFVQNHIAHYVTNNSTADTKSVIMLNSKWLDAKAGSFHGVPYAADRSNLQARNGLLHVLEREAAYSYNVYEGLTSLPRYAHVGSFFKSYEKMELNENASIPSGIVDGQIIYSDSVMYRYNILFNRFGLVNEEDSDYIMLMPDARVWEKVYAEALSHYNYGTTNKADSLQRYWANASLVRDLVYNRNVGCLHWADSVCSTSYSIYDEDRRHVYYNPLQPGGIFSSTYVRDTMACSNGAIYNLSEWPFTAEQIYFFPVKTEAEIESMMTEYNLCVPSYLSALADSVSDGYLDIRPASSSSNWTAEFRIPNVLSGTYDICAVVLPKTVANPNSRDFKPNKFKATLTYETLDGTPATYAFEDERTNDPYRVDTVVIGRFDIPVCGYGLIEPKVRLRLECSIERRENRYSREMYLDCLYFKPVKEEE